MLIGNRLLELCSESKEFSICRLQLVLDLYSQLVDLLLDLAAKSLRKEKIISAETVALFIQRQDFLGVAFEH